MKIRTAAPSVWRLALLLPASLFAQDATSQIEIQREGIQMIQQLEEVARDVRYNAGRLNSFTRDAKVSTWTHSHHLTQIKQLVNDGLRPALARLEAIQSQLPSWKQRSITGMIEAANTLAADTNAAILASPGVSGVLPAMNAEYKNRIQQMEAHAEGLVKMSDAAGTYAAARLKAAQAGVPVPVQ